MNSITSFDKNIDNLFIKIFKVSYREKLQNKNLNIIDTKKELTLVPIEEKKGDNESSEKIYVFVY
jgi:hypothetical protein